MPRLAPLLASLLIAPAAALAQPWPDLADAGSWTFAANRLSVHTGTLAATDAQRSALSHVYQVSPDHPAVGLRLAFVNFWVDQSGGPTVERCPGNPKTVDFATVFVGAAAYPVTFDGATSAVIGDCDLVWSDPLRDASGEPVTLRPGTAYFIRSSQTVAAGQRLTQGNALQLNGRHSHAALGEGVEYTGTPQLARRLAGTVAAVGNGSALMGPALAVAQGWDGRPAAIIVGDSNGVGQSDLDFSPATRGVTGFVARALDDATTGRWTFANLSVGGTRPGTQASVATGEYGLRMRLLRSIPNRPFNRVVVQMGANGLFSSLAQWQAEMRALWAFWREACPACRIYQTTFGPRAQAREGTRWTDAARMVPTEPAIDAWPNGRRWQATRWLTAGDGLPPYLTVLDVSPALRDEANPAAFKVSTSSWTLDAPATTSPVTSTIRLSGDTAPTPGDAYVLDAGTPDAQTVFALTVSGSGPWSVRLSGNLSRGHPIGAKVRKAPTSDGLHMGATPHKEAAASLIQMKVDGTLR